MDLYPSRLLPIHSEPIGVQPIAPDTPYPTQRGVTRQAGPEDEWARNFATYRTRRWIRDDDSTEIDSTEAVTPDVDPNQIEPIPEAERTLTSIREVEKLPQGEGAFARLDVIRWIQGKWQTAGPCEKARPYYEAWQASPKGPAAQEPYYDALFHELVQTGKFFYLLDDAMSDWTKSGRLTRQIHLYRVAYPHVDEATATRKIREGFMAWHLRAGVLLDRNCGWNLLSEADNRAKRLPDIKPVLQGWSLQAVSIEWEWWHKKNVEDATARGEPFDSYREARVLNKMLILKQLLDVSLARQTASQRAADAERDSRDW